MTNSTNQAGFSWQDFERMPIVGIIRGMSLEDFKHILPIYLKAGFSTIEVTMNTADIKEQIEYVLKEFPGLLNVGAGTVCSLLDLYKALDFGSQFIVTPIVNEEVIKECIKKGIPIFPGALTPSEIYKAWDLGAPIVKLFPAGHLGASYIQDIKAPLNKVRLMTTGGVSIDNIQKFLSVGIDCFGIGSPLFDKSLIQAKDWVGLERHFMKYITVINDFKKGFL